MTGELMETVLAAMEASEDVTSVQLQRFEDDPYHCTSDSKAKVKAGKTGNAARCGKPPIEGGWVCTTHGGKTPKVVEKAEKRIETANALAIVKSMDLEVPDDMTPQEVLQEAMRSQVQLQRKLKRLADEKGDAVTQVDTSAGGGLKISPETTHAMYQDALKAQALIARAGIQSGLEERKVELDQAQLRLHVQELLPRITGLLESLGHSLDDPAVQRALEQHFS